MTDGDKSRIRRKIIMKAVANGWELGAELLKLEEVPGKLENFIFDTGFGRSLWGEDMIVLRDIKTTRGQTISEEAWRFHQHILLDFIQIQREELAYEYLEQYLDK